MTLSLIVAGAFGRMGRAVIDLCLTQDQFYIESGIINADSKQQKPSHWLFPLYNNLTAASPQKNSIIIDFSKADLLPLHLAIAKERNCGIVIATTGHSDAHYELIKNAALSIPIVVAPNTSLMASALLACVEFLASHLPDSSANITELHHIHKKDAPSGTAKALLAAINENSSEMKPEIHSLRHGEVVGEHTVSFFNKFERLELFHRVEDRRVFAQGALVAAQFLFRNAPGLYSMKDVLNMNLTIKNED